MTQSRVSRSTKIIYAVYLIIIVVTLCLGISCMIGKVPLW